MADKEGPQAPAPQGGPNQNPPPNQNPQNLTPNQNPQNPLPPLNPCVPNAPQALEIPCVPQLNWSHFKPKYSGKPYEDAEARILRMNDLMDTHKFPDQVEVQRFCLTLVGEARFWYVSLRLINVDMADLQNILSR